MSTHMKVGFPHGVLWFGPAPSQFGTTSLMAPPGVPDQASQQYLILCHLSICSREAKSYLCIKSYSKPTGCESGSGRIGVFWSIMSQENWFFLKIWVQFWIRFFVHRTFFPYWKVFFPTGNFFSPNNKKNPVFFVRSSFLRSAPDS